MTKDYRNTKYCPILSELLDKKKKIKDTILEEHPKAKDLHKYISDNSSTYKEQFVKAYNAKCSYCGVSNDIIDWKLFEIDHFIPKEAARFVSKSKAGYIENLVLSCYDCNRAKSNLELPDEDHAKVHPDKANISKTFFRDDDYYIKISKNFLNDESVKEFYQQLNLGNELHRLDYLLMNIRGLRDSLKDKPALYMKLNEVYELMKKKEDSLVMPSKIKFACQRK